MTNGVKLQPILLGLGTALLPVYIFPSGGMQPAHLVLSLLIFRNLSAYGIRLDGFFRTFLFTTAYFMAVELAYSLLQATAASLINPVFFLYNFLLVVAVYDVVHKSGLRTIRFGIFVACAIALFSVLLTGVNLRSVEDGGRPSGTFNNPNQLGFFSCCLLSVSYLLYRHDYLKYWHATLLFSASLMLSIFSLSKAAMLANFAVFLIVIFPRGGRKAVISGFFIVIVLTFILYFSFVADQIEDLLFFQRLLNMFEEPDSSAEARGYFVFLEGNILQFFFGMGSENILEVLGHEVHSTIASVFNNYGFIGFLSFASTILIWGKKIFLAYGFVGSCALLGPSLLYGLTHNGIRFTIFWLLVSISLAMAQRILDSQSVKIS